VVELRWGKCLQGFRRMAGKSTPAGIRSLVYGVGKGKVGIEGLSVSPALAPNLGSDLPRTSKTFDE
jgi:hypothetical protein